MNSVIDYKNKAIKYKLKYHNLKNKMMKLNFIDNNIPEWYLKFQDELNEIYTFVSNYYPNVVLTGSGAIAYLLSVFKLYDELLNFKPNDLDFIYKARIAKPNPKIINNYKIKSGQENESSVTFILNEDKDKFIKSFDVSRTSPNIKSFNLNGIEILDFNTLKSYYKPGFETPEERIEKDKYKISLIDKIINKIGEERRLNEFSLDYNITERKKSNFKPKTLFDDDDDDNINSLKKNKY